MFESSASTISTEGSNILVDQGTPINIMRRPAALADLKELFFLLSILLSSRVYSICRTEDATHRSRRSSKEEGANQINCKERMTTICSARAWGVASVSLALIILLFPSIHILGPVLINIVLIIIRYCCRHSFQQVSVSLSPLLLFLFLPPFSKKLLV